MRRLLRVLKFTTIIGLSTGAIVAIALILGNRYVESVADGEIFDDINMLPSNEVGLVLGTSHLLKSGHLNPYFQYRVNAAAKLYHSGKVKYLIVSGDNGRKEYDEATDMRNALVKLGVPINRIYMDYAGFRTLDSVVRCHKIFGQLNFTIISQKFHNQRAVFLANEFGINAVAYNCTDLSFNRSKWVHARESVARMKAIIDVVLGVGPKFLGEKITIGKPQGKTND